MLPRRSEKHSDAVKGCSFSPDGTQIASLTRVDAVTIWDIRSGHGKVLRNMDAQTISFSPDSERLAVGEGPPRCFVKVFWAQMVRKPRSSKDTEAISLHVSWSPDGRAIASASRDGTVKVWNAFVETTRLEQPRKHDAALCYRTVSRMSAYSDRALNWLKRLRKPRSSSLGLATTVVPEQGKVLLPPHLDETGFAVDGEHLIVAAKGALLMFRGTRPLPIAAFPWSVQNGSVLSSSADGSRYIKPSEATLFDATGKVVATLRPGQYEEVVAFSPDGSRIARYVHREPDRAPVYIFAATEEAAAKYADQGEKAVVMYDAQSGRDIAVIRGGSNRVIVQGEGKGTGLGVVNEIPQVLFSPDGKLVFTSQSAAGSMNFVSGM